MWCPSALVQAGAKSLSSSHVWNNLNRQILDSTYGNLPIYQSLNSTLKEEYNKWVDMLFSFYTASRLRRSVMNPAPPKEIIQILKMAAEIRLHNSLVSDEKDKRSLRIIVLGGSVTAAMSCSWPEILGMEKPSHWSIPGPRCGWSFLLEKILDDVIFEGGKILKIENYAVGGQTSESGTLMLEYHQFPKPEEPPDIIIAAYSANESREPDTNLVFYEFMQNFLKAAQTLHPCNDNAPLVMMVDDFYNVEPSLSLEQTGKLYMLSHWNNLMSVDYSGILRYKIAVENITWAPLLGSDFQVHNGIGMHMGIGWTVAFNILNSIVNVCGDPQNETNNHPGDYPLRPSGANASDNEHSSSPLTIDPDLQPNLQKGEPAFQQFPKVRQTGGSVDDVRREYEANVKSKNEFCHKLEENPELRSSVKCPWSWFYNRMTSFSQAHQVNRKMNEVLFFNTGWNAEGNPVRQPRSGWYTHSPDSMFSIKVENVPVDIKTVVIVAMKSYSGIWVGSKLAVSISVVESAAIPDSMNNRTSAVDWNEDSVFLIDGYHNVKTSVHFPYKLPIEGGAKAGESIIVDFKLVGGAEFKIAGMAVCAY
eukprot:jgi/Psemu1/52976/gm1.52976_g